MPLHPTGETDGSLVDFDALRQERARQIVARHERVVKQYVRMNLSSRIRHKEGTSAVAQDIFKSFFESPAQVADPDGIWPLLLTFAERKVKNAARRYRRGGKRDVWREEMMSSSPHSESDADPMEQIQERQNNPAAAQAAIIVEELDRLDEREREMLIMRASGFTLEEIAERMGCSEREVRRTLEAVCERWHIESRT